MEAALRGALPPQFRAKLIRLDGEKAEIPTGEIARPLVEQLRREKFVVIEVTKKERRRNAPPPFITSKLQQEAANRLGFTAKKTMTLAQRLYEGVELGDDGQTALITYMRTDSVRLSPDAVTGARAYVAERWGKDYLPAEPVQFKTKKSAQDAHEAIRPTSLDYPPERVQPFLERDMFRLYELIWNRFVACQMVPAVYDQTTADISAGRATFRAIGRPSTYAAILSTIQDKEYVEKKENRFYPTELGKIVTELLLSAFPRVMDVQFTAKMEEELDEVEEGKQDWVKLLGDFYGPFKK